MIPLRLIASLAGEAHLFHAAKGREIARVLTSENRAGIDWETGVADRIAASDGRKPYRVQDGLAIIPVDGSLMHRWESVRPESGSTGYDGIRASLTEALNDKAVSGIVLDIDSPGGMVSGCAECAAMIREASKPVAAYVDAMAYSAAYWLASQADIIVATPTAGVGSIGALMMHVDQSGAAEQRGLSVTIVHSGENKIDGNPFEPLPDDVRADIQSRLDAIRVDFANAVGEGRGERFTAAQAMATEARDFRADEALSMGMIDAIARPDQAISTISDLLARASGLNPSTNGGSIMTDNARASGGGETVLDAQASAKMVADARAAGVAEGRDAVLAIMNLPEAQGREAAAAKMAAQGATPEMAASLLAMIPAAGAEAQAGSKDQSPDVAQVARDAANAAIRAMMDNAEGTGIESDPVASADQKGGGEKFAAAVF